MHERTTTAEQTEAATPPSAPITATDFKRDSRRKDVVAQLVATLPAAEAAQLAPLLRSTMQQLGSASRQDNVANALATTLAIAYAVLEVPDFDESKANALVGIANDTLAASPQFARLGAADRQHMYDSLLLSAAVIALMHQAGDTEGSQAIAKQVLQQLVGVTP